MAHAFCRRLVCLHLPSPPSLRRQPVPASLKKKDYEKDKGSQGRREQIRVGSQFSALGQCCSFYLCAHGMFVFIAFIINEMSMLLEIAIIKYG